MPIRRLSIRSSIFPTHMWLPCLQKRQRKRKKTLESRVVLATPLCPSSLQHQAFPSTKTFMNDRLLRLTQTAFGTSSTFEKLSAIAYDHRKCFTIKRETIITRFADKIFLDFGCIGVALPLSFMLCEFGQLRNLLTGRMNGDGS